MEEVLAVLRRPDGLVRLVRGGGATREVAGSGDDSLDRAWARLARVRVGSAEDLEVVRRVWSATAPVAERWSPPPIGTALRPPTPPKASAAHPRAYAGTIHKPPKAATPTVDLRTFERWASVCRTLAIDEPHPLLAARPAHPALDVDALEPSVREALPVLFALSVAELERIDRLVRRAELPRHFLFLASADPAALAPWLEALHVLDDERRAELQQVLGEATLPPAKGELLAALARVASLGSDGFVGRVRRFVAALHQGASADYVAGGLELELEFPPSWTNEWALAKAGTTDVGPLVREVAERLGDELPGYLPESLHASLGALPLAGDFVRDALDGPDTSDRELVAWLECLSLVAAPEGPPRSLKWQLVRDGLRERDDVSSAHRVGYARRIREALWWLTFDRARDVPTSIALAKLSAPTSDEVFYVLIELSVAGLEVAVTEPLLAALHATLRTRSRAPLVSNGPTSLIGGAPAFAAQLLDEHPKRAVRLALTIGAPHPSRATPAVERAREEPLWARPEITTLHERLEEVMALATDVLPRALRRSLEGDLVLSEARQRRHLARVHERWGLVRAALVERAVAAELQRGVTDAPRALETAESHALALLTRAGRHRRALRRLLRDVLNGRGSNVLSHPATQRWLETHSWLDVERWTAGLRWVETTPDHGKVTLAFEHDPLEVLRLGDYVRTCLALGAMLESDPVGIALDVNKQVVYARDARGRVLARQLVAVSEAGALVCYSLYSVAATSDSLDELFLRYDRALAEHLDLPMADGAEYRVAMILSREYWDDGEWDRLVDDSDDVDGSQRGRRSS